MYLFALTFKVLYVIDIILLIGKYISNISHNNSNVTNIPIFKEIIVLKCKLLSIEHQSKNFKNNYSFEECVIIIFIVEPFIKKGRMQFSYNFTFMIKLESEQVER